MPLKVSVTCPCLHEVSLSALGHALPTLASYCLFSLDTWTGSRLILPITRDAPSGWCWSLARPMASSDPVPGGLWTEGLASVRELCRAGGQPDLGCPITDASQDWFYSVLVQPPCPRRALSGLWRQLCSLGALPARASSSRKPQRPLETASWGYTHAHTQAHSVHTHRHGADMTRDTCVFMDANTF